MASLKNQFRDLGHGPLRNAVLLGIVSIPFTIGINWVFVFDGVQALPLFIACVASGYLSRSQRVNGMQAGIVTGISGGIPILFWQSGVAVSAWWGNPILVDVVGDSWLMNASSAGAGVLTAGILTLVLIVVGVIGGLLGQWMDDRFSSKQAANRETERA